MKNFLLFIVCILMCRFVIAQAVISKPVTAMSSVSIIDFGATPGDNKDDTWAFIKAGKYLSNLWDKNGVPLKPGKTNFSYSKYSAQLEIPSGTYLVGKQIQIPKNGLHTSYGKIFGDPSANAPLVYPANTTYKAGLELITLDNPVAGIDQVVITGTGKTKPLIKYNDHMVIGYFDSNGTPQFMDGSNYNAKFNVTIGSFVQATACKNLVVKNIEINGNNAPVTDGGTTIYNGGMGNSLVQMGAAGLYLVNSKNITIQDMYIHHMTLDGLVFQDYYKDPVKYKSQAPSALLIDKLNLDNNRRQAFSWVGGKGIKVTNSIFNNTSASISGIAEGKPAAGVDIEPEADNAGNLLYCMDGYFLNCEFVNNKGCAMVNDDITNRTQNIIFDSCRFHDVDSYSVWARGNGIIFNQCKIWGGFVFGNEGLSAKSATIFNSCDFADEELPERPGKYNEGYALVENWKAARRMQFNNCTFRTLHKNQKLLALYTPSVIESELTTFSGCTFSVGTKSSAVNVLFGSRFEKNTKIISYNKDQSETFLVNGIVISGSNNSKMPNTFKMEGKVLFNVANSNGLASKQFLIGRNEVSANLNDGYVNFIIGNGSCLYGYWDQTIDIGKNSKLINSAGGQLALLSGKINNQGSVVLENESNTAFFNPVAITSAGTETSNFHYNKNAATAIAAPWGDALKGLGKPMKISLMKIDKKMKFQGDNIDIPAIKTIAK